MYGTEEIFVCMVFEFIYRVGFTSPPGLVLIALVMVAQLSVAVTNYSSKI